MSSISLFGSSILSTVFIILCFYFVLNFFQHLKNNDAHLANQSKLAAVIFLALALIIPGLVSMFVMYLSVR